MIYKNFKDVRISMLSMGTMRLPTCGDGKQIDEPAVQEMVDTAIRSGINYFDTAWGYHGGESERVIGRCLAKYPRESFLLASKFPGYDVSNMDKVEPIFEEQLKKCGVEYFDFYLVHNVCERNIVEYLDPKFGIYPYLVEQRRKGRIRHLGFSAHGSPETMKRFFAMYGDAMEFCQLQINYLDWEFQRGREKVELLREWGLPLWVMEPLRGGSLASMLETERRAMAKLDPEALPLDWAYRFLQSVDATTVLTGASSLQQLRENIARFERERPLNETEFAALQKAAGSMLARKTVPCTACRYCVSHCPQGLDIPAILFAYNEHKYTGGGFIAPMLVKKMPEGKKPHDCLACGKCSAVCPQKLDIPGLMKDFVEILR